MSGPEKQLFCCAKKRQIY